MKLRTIAVDDEPLALKRLQIALDRVGGVDLVGTASDGEKALDLIRKEAPDLILLDVRMPLMDGFELLQTLRNDPVPEVIFITAYSAFAVRAFEEGAVGYVLKPVEEDRLRAALERARSKLRNKDAEQRLEAVAATLEKLQSGESQLQPRFEQELWINHGNLIERVAIGDVTWFEAAGDYVAVHCGQKEYLLYDSLRSLIERLDPDEFVRVHRKAIVRLGAVEAIERGRLRTPVLRFTDGTRVPISRTYRSAILARVRARSARSTGTNAPFGEEEVSVGEK